MDLILNLLIFSLVLLAVVSFSLFIRRLLINSSLRNFHYKEIEAKLDEIKDLLIKERSK